MAFWWKKKKNDVIDFTKFRSLSPNSVSAKNDSVLDLGTNNVKNENSSEVNLGFLDNLANASSGAKEVQSNNYWNKASSPGPITDSLREARRQRLKAAFNEMKNKIDDSDFKISSLNRKIDDIEERLKEIERRRN